MSTTSQLATTRTPNMTWLLFWDELNGFAKSTVMVAMWVGMPLLGISLYFILPSEFPLSGSAGMKMAMPASTFMSLMLSSTAGLLAATLVSIEIVNEKNKKIYDLFLIRPVKRSGFMWAKFFAVAFCVSIALIFSMVAGVLVDVIRGIEISPLMLESLLDSTLSGVGMIVVSAAAGILIGMFSNSVIMAVMLVWFIGQYVMLIPMIPMLLGMFSETISLDWLKWIIHGLTVVVTILMVLFASALFKRMEV